MRWIPSRPDRRVGNTLEDLPEHRREHMLWRYAPEADYDEVDELVRLASRQDCQIPLMGTPPRLDAALGDDGRYHLLREGEVRCGWRAKRSRPDDPFRHWDLISVFTDGSRYWRQVHVDNAPLYRSVCAEAAWDVRLIGDPVPAESVAFRERCPALPHTDWPPCLEGARARLRRRLQDELGKSCATCGDLGIYMDHALFTGWIRGLLCHYCNTHIDTCPHVDRCRWADYLNDPPAAHLHLQHPRARDRMHRSRKKIEAVGFDPFLELRARTGR